ncbi:MAG TPA: hypothetical protein DER23_10410 [Clostridiales bacterium]|jgi:YbbR domain-containing protein|nr:hypothetical protein [Clostridiales bacterium]
MLGKLKKGKEQALQTENKQSNWAARVLSVLCAIILWFYVMSVESINFEKTYSGLTLGIHGTETLEGLSLSGLTTSTVEITITGEKKQLEGMGSEWVKPYVDLPETVAKGQYTLPVKLDGIPDNMNVSVYPQKVTVLIEDTDTREVPLTRVAGSHDDSLLEYNFSFTHVTVTGSVSVLEQIDHAELDISTQNLGNTMDGSYFGKIILVNKDGNKIVDSYLTKSSDYATVEVKVLQSKKLDLTITSSSGESLSIIYEKESAKTIVVKGEASVISALPTYLSLRTINLSEIESGVKDSKTYVFAYHDITRALPEGVVLIAVDNVAVADLKEDSLPSAVLTVSLKNTKVETTLTVSLKSATVKSLSSSLHVTFDPNETVDIVLSGQRNDLKNITAKDLNLVVNMYGKTAKGWVNVPLLVTLKETNENVEIITKEFTLRVFVYAK